MAYRKIKHVPKLRVFLSVKNNRYELASPVGLSWQELNACGVIIKKDDGAIYVPVIL